MFDTVGFTPTTFDPATFKIIDEIKYDLLWNREKWENYERDFNEFKEHFDREAPRIIEEIALQEYQSLWGLYSWEINNYGLVIETGRDHKTRVIFQGQEVLHADNPCEALRTIPKVIEMLRDVHKELLEEDKANASV